jgi:hypothetical protein
MSDLVGVLSSFDIVLLGLVLVVLLALIVNFLLWQWCFRTRSQKASFSFRCMKRKKDEYDTEWNGYILN